MSVQHERQPYPGLRPYNEDEGEHFFGREADTRILLDKIVAHRLTLLFAATGVGKSSLLKASVIPKLKSPRGKNLSVIYYLDWVSSPIEGLKAAIEKTLQTSAAWPEDAANNLDASLSLSDFLEFCTLFIRQPLIIVLDQFEELFRYRYKYHQDNFKPFIAQITELITSPHIPVNLVFSMREDFALELNVFKPKLPTLLFENYYRLDRLTAKAARKAIKIPVEQIGFHYQSALLDQMIDDLLSRDLDRSSSSLASNKSLETVEPPYLQIVCSQLWQREQHNHDQILHQSTYDKAGGAKGLTENYVQEIIKGFSDREKQLASKAFDHLISHHGTKMAHTPASLAELTHRKKAELRKLLEKLASNEIRILRSQQRAEKIWYELYHDMFSDSIEKWNIQWKNKMRTRKTIITTMITLAGIHIIYFATVWAANHHNYYLRLASGEDNTIEIYHGAKDWPDLFGQKHFAYNSRLLSHDLEPDKRFEARHIFDYGDLNHELIGYQPLEKRITKYIEAGYFSQAVQLAQKSISANSPARSRQMIRDLFSLKTVKAFDILRDEFAMQKKSSHANLTATLFFQENTLQRPLTKTKLLSFHFFQTTFKSITPYKLEIMFKAIDDPRLINSIIQLLQDKNDFVRQNAVDALGLIGDVSATQPLTNTIKDKNQNVRLNAAKALALIGSNNTKQTLTDVIKDENENVRYEVVYTLGLMGNVSAIPTITQFIKDENADVRRYAVEALGRIGDASIIPLLTDAIKDENEEVRRNAAKALGNIRDASAIPALKHIIKDESENVRLYAVKALGFIGDASAIQPLTEAVKDKNGSVRGYAAYALGLIGDTSAITPLTAAIKDEDENVRRDAAEALGLIADTKAIPALISAIKDKNKEVQRQAAKSLGLIGDPRATTALINTIKNKKGEGRHYAVQALGLIGGVNAISTLTNALKDENEDVRRDAATVLGFIDDTSVIKPLINAIKDKKESVRREAVKALGLIGDASAISPLAEVIKDENEEMRRYAAQALGNISDTRAIPSLTEAIKDEDEVVRREVAEALGLTGDVRAIAPLINAIKDENELVRRKAAKALGLIGDARAILPLTNALKDKNELVRRKAAEALEQIAYPSKLKFLSSKSHSQQVRSFKWIDFFLSNHISYDGKLSGIKDKKENKQQLLQLLNLPLSKDRNQQLLALAQRTDTHISIRKKAIETLGKSKDISLSKHLRKLQTEHQLKDTIKQAIEQLTPPKPAFEIFNDRKQKHRKRLAALKRLTKEEPILAKQTLLHIAQQKEDVFSSLAYRLLGDMQVTRIIRILEKHLSALEKQDQDWRKLRDSKPNPSDEDIDTLKQVKSKILQHTAFDYGYALSRLDPERGLELLNHPLNGVRKGAYMGFAMKANIAWLRKLDAKREQASSHKNKPIFRYAAFRAIDLGLNRLEILGKQKEIDDLKAWRNIIKNRPLYKNDRDDEVLERLEWTIMMMEHYQKLEVEFKRDYDKIRVWPKNILPVNEDYPSL